MCRRRRIKVKPSIIDHKPVNGWLLTERRTYQGNAKRNYWSYWEVYKLDDEGYMAATLGMTFCRKKDAILAANLGLSKEQLEEAGMI